MKVRLFKLKTKQTKKLEAHALTFFMATFFENSSIKKAVMQISDVFIQSIVTMPLYGHKVTVIVASSLRNRHPAMFVLVKICPKSSTALHITTVILALKQFSFGFVF